MKPAILILLTSITINLFSQKQSFDVVSYSAPKNWQQVQNEGGMQLSVTDKRTGAYAIAIITKATASDATAAENFNTDWTRLVKSTVQVNGEPAMQDPQQENGWDIVSGNANYTDGSNKGLATLLTATGGGQMVSVVLLTNTQQYQNELLSFINSLELAKAEQHEPGNTGQSAKSSVVGLWCDYVLETTGYNINGMPQYTAGYLRKEYTFYSDGTYLFRNKQWLTKTKDILFIYESGTYVVRGNQLTITPGNGKSGFWGKTASSKEWGKLVKTSDYKLEKITYTFEIIIDPNYGNSIVLKPSKPTQRDGGQFNAANDPYEFHYHFRELESLIDNPPGLKTGFENKPVNAAPATKAINDPQANTNKPGLNSPITGSWSYSISETQFGTMTNGYSTRQYTFNNDGTYLFRYKVFSSVMNVLLFQYENGNYNLNGNQLVISPLSGANEEWSQDKNHPDQWGKLLKTGKRKLEKVTYTLTLHYFSGIKETDLILQTSKPTEREGQFGTMQDYPGGWAFKPCNPNNNPLIDTPPGFEKNAENKPAIDSGELMSNQPGNTTNSLLTGKIWEARSPETYGAAYGSMSGFYTGGFWYYQYKFNANGTYTFVYNAASALANNPVNVLQYETGTYAATGNSLTLTPQKGANEEWSTGKINNGMSADHIQEVLEKRIQRLKTTTRKLEKTTYPFTVEYWQGNNANALCLKHTQNTVREGSPGQNDQSCFFETTAAKAENYNALFK